MEIEKVEKLTFSEKREFASLIRDLREYTNSRFIPEDIQKFRTLMRSGMAASHNAHNSKGLSNAILTLKSALLFAQAIEPDHNILLAIGLYPLLTDGQTDIITLRKEWGEDVAGLLTGLSEVDKFSSKNNAVNQDNFRGLLLSLADDIRVIIIMIVRNLVLMRSINHHPDEEWVRNVAFEANYLYAQLAHRLGLYKIKGELEDLSLKYTNREIYTQIAHKLNETKRSREAYIKSFIDPVKEKLLAAGLKFEIKGRTKSISSIWNKMKKQKVDVSGIYDLFAIRVIIDTPREKEKSDCWLAYSILADMYTANPARMKDWISLPKSNGYESLHATVMGPGSKWVEVQFRTRRMDLVAEKGLAAHWRYKGVKSDSTDQWMNNIRDILETAETGPMQLMKDMRMDVYGKEVFAFTPKGDLFRLGAGATVLDFAFHIHSNVGAHCTGAVVNGQHKKITYRINNGDTVEILTSTTQTPKADWLNIVVSTKARNKIKQSLNEEMLRRAELGKELLERRAKNRKIEIEESVLMKLINKAGYKFANEFFADMADNKIDPGKFLSTYLEETTAKSEGPKVSAGEFHMQPSSETESKADVVVIGEKSINGLNYKFAKCCSPIYGDEVFGFISSDGTVKIHRCDCPNAENIRSRYPYRIIKADWSGKQGDMLPVSLKIIGNDDIGILANITSIISKEAGTNLRNITVDSNDGMFQGVLVVAVSEQRQLTSLLKKLKTVKGVKNIQRL
ncbi:MAG: bifunctional (p)ppGpp synthetase/guanosine-3',5'-bis(diphosphate) 3'-pyrophosphohydrolase [Bacteroides sp.]|nr:bifunctional (p)ppGpp synthetase/guanosine-3',5'-bis(diphosphate) 3'-pyrophosphohydrolase [Bacteroides sp.]